MKIGDYVSIIPSHSDEPPRRGTICYLGPVKDKIGDWVGIELESKNGHNDGKVAGVRYFQCKPGFGIFVNPSRLRILPRLLSPLSQSSLAPSVSSNKSTTTFGKLAGAKDNSSTASENMQNLGNAKGNADTALSMHEFRLEQKPTMTVTESTLMATPASQIIRRGFDGDATNVSPKLKEVTTTAQLSEDMAQRQAELNKLRNQIESVKHVFNQSSAFGVPNTPTDHLSSVVGRLSNLMSEYDRVVSKYERQLKHLIDVKQEKQINGLRDQASVETRPDDAIEFEKLQSQVYALQGERINLLERLKNSQAAMKEWKKLQDNQLSASHTTNEKIDQLQKQLSSQYTVYEELVAEKTQLTSELASVRAELEANQWSMAQKDASLQEKIGLLTWQLGEANEQKNKLQGTVETLTTELDALKNNIASLRGEYAKLQAENCIPRSEKLEIEKLKRLLEEESKLVVELKKGMIDAEDRLNRTIRTRDLMIAELQKQRQAGDISSSPGSLSEQVLKLSADLDLMKSTYDQTERARITSEEYHKKQKIIFEDLLKEKDMEIRLLTEEKLKSGEISEELSKCKAELAEDKERINQLESQLYGSDEKDYDLKNLLTELDELKMENQKISDQYRQEIEKRPKEQKRLDSDQEMIEEMKQRIESLELQKSQLEAKASVLEQSLKETNVRLEGNAQVSREASNRLSDLQEEKEKLWKANLELTKLAGERERILEEMRSKIDAVRVTVEGQLEKRLAESQRYSSDMEERLYETRMALQMAKSELIDKENQVRAAETELLHMSQMMDDEKLKYDEAIRKTEEFAKKLDENRHNLDLERNLMDRQLIMVEKEKELLEIEIERLTGSGSALYGIDSVYGRREGQNDLMDVDKNFVMIEKLKEIKRKMDALETKYGGPEAIAAMFARLSRIVRQPIQVVIEDEKTDVKGYKGDMDYITSSPKHQLDEGLFDGWEASIGESIKASSTDASNLITNDSLARQRRYQRTPSPKSLLADDNSLKLTKKSPLRLTPSFYSSSILLDKEGSSHESSQYETKFMSSTSSLDTRSKGEGNGNGNGEGKLFKYRTGSELSSLKTTDSMTNSVTSLSSLGTTTSEPTNFDDSGNLAVLQTSLFGSLHDEDSSQELMHSSSSSSSNVECGICGMPGHETFDCDEMRLLASSSNNDMSMTERFISLSSPLPSYLQSKSRLMDRKKEGESYKQEQNFGVEPDVDDGIGQKDISGNVRFRTVKY